MATSSTPFTYTKNTIETTEWEDVLVKKGIIEERAEVRFQRESRKEASKRTGNAEESLGVDAIKTRRSEYVEGLDFQGINDAEDELDDDEFRRIREKRLRELRARAARQKFGSVIRISKPDFVKEVTEESKTSWVVVELCKSYIEASEKMSACIDALAQKHRETKFVRIESTQCIENWPDANVPCLFVYHSGDMQTQLVGLGHVGGLDRLDVDVLEWSLSHYWRNQNRQTCTSCPKAI